MTLGVNQEKQNMQNGIKEDQKEKPKEGIIWHLGLMD